MIPGPIQARPATKFTRTIKHSAARRSLPPIVPASSPFRALCASVLRALFKHRGHREGSVGSGSSRTFGTGLREFLSESTRVVGETPFSETSRDALAGWILPTLPAIRVDPGVGPPTAQRILGQPQEVTLCFPKATSSAGALRTVARIQRDQKRNRHADSHSGCG